MDYKVMFKGYQEMINKKLGIFLKEKLRKAGNISPAAKEMMEHCLEFNMRSAKRLRPILVILGYKAAGGRDEKAIVDAAIAVELMQSFLLIHDDIIDQDELRRGYLTMHKIYENRYENRSIRKRPGITINQTDDACYSKRYGENMAIITGDILAVLGSEAVLSSDFPVKNKLKAADVFNRAVINTCFGQADDIELSMKHAPKEEEIMRLYLLKTALYTIDAPIQIGAVLAGADDSLLDSIRSFSVPMGQAFQIQDDILGIFGTEKEIGKPIGSDIKEGKNTILVVKAMKSASPKDKVFLKKCLGNDGLTEIQVQKFRKIILSTGSYEYSRKLAESLIDKSIKNIKKSRIKNNTKGFLLWLCDYIISRGY